MNEFGYRIVFPKQDGKYSVFPFEVQTNFTKAKGKLFLKNKEYWEKECTEFNERHNCDYADTIIGRGVIFDEKEGRLRRDWVYVTDVCCWINDGFYFVYDYLLQEVKIPPDGERVIIVPVCKEDMLSHMKRNNKGFNYDEINAWPILNYTIYHMI